MNSENFNPEDYEHQDRPNGEPPFHHGKHGRPGAMPTPPGAETVDSKPVTTRRSKTVMLRAERHDEVEIQLVVSGMTHVPETLTVVQRTDTYYGPRLLCHADVDGEDTNWVLTCPGPNTQLILWQAVSGLQGKWRSGWVPVSEVQAKLGDVKQYKTCEHCGEPLQDIWHERQSAFGLCGGDDGR